MSARSCLSRAIVGRPVGVRCLNGLDYQQFLDLVAICGLPYLQDQLGGNRSANMSNICPRIILLPARVTGRACLVVENLGGTWVGSLGIVVSPLCAGQSQRRAARVLRAFT